MHNSIALVAEDSTLLGSQIKKNLEEQTPCKILWVRSRSELTETLAREGNKISVAIVNYVLAGAPSGEAIEQTTALGIPTITFTGIVDEAIRARVWSCHVADYVLKDSPYSLDYVVAMVKRIIRNQAIKVMVVDDSSSIREVMGQMLRIHRYQVLTAATGPEALALLENHPETRLVITDYNMPGMDGIALVQKIREKNPKDQMAIIGISAAGDTTMAARFIKNGSNDFLIKKAFLPEEFYCRVTQCIDQLEQLEAIRQAAVRDHMTGLYNRRYFFEMGGKMLAAARRKDEPIACAMVDIDHFKKVNDTYGHQAGDLVLKKVASLLATRCRESDVAARFGGEEFCLLAANVKAENAKMVFESFRNVIAMRPIEIGGGQAIPVTVSIGVCTERSESLDEMIKIADGFLYKAKHEGRNRTICR
ncbi:MAG: diguanylate cyclase [Deltaproteobacteria bacterium]|nr:diguanylate cyclase [Deltaproteobacteria bacterium]